MSGLSDIHVLLVDDNDNMREIISVMLKGAGIKKIKAVADGEEAIRTLAWFSADIAVVDYNMAPVNGVEFTRFIRTSPLSPNPFLPIILMTGHAERTKVVVARDAGIHEFMVKPITARGLLGRFNAILAKPRPFVRTAKYFGPDRRRLSAENYDGPLMRSTDRIAESEPDANVA
jgi:CheY-like chemotaxis protein